MGSVGDINCVLFRFFFWDGYWGNVFRDSDGYFGELLNIEEEPEEFGYEGASLGEVFLEFLCAVDDYDEIEERMQEDVEVPPLTDEELDEMYQRFLARLRERYPDEGDDGEEK